MSMTTQLLLAGPRRHPLRWLAVATLAAALASGCSGKGKDKDKAEEKETAVPVETQPLKRAEMVAVYSGTAPIEAHEEAVVVAKVGAVPE
jgi:PBP1b-binding outer membrane lipoprotein LpoB